MTTEGFSDGYLYRKAGRRSIPILLDECISRHFDKSGYPQLKAGETPQMTIMICLKHYTQRLECRFPHQLRHQRRTAGETKDFNVKMTNQLTHPK